MKERIKQFEQQKVTIPDSEVKRIDWIEMESGKRFLTKKELGKYLGIAAGTISNQMSKSVFPIRPKRVGNHIRFDMREILVSRGICALESGLCPAGWMMGAG